MTIYFKVLWQKFNKLACQNRRELFLEKLGEWGGGGGGCRVQVCAVRRTFIRLISICILVYGVM